jgi:hypothetical protein
VRSPGGPAPVEATGLSVVRPRPHRPVHGRCVPDDPFHIPTAAPPTTQDRWRALDGGCEGRRRRTLPSAGNGVPCLELRPVRACSPPAEVWPRVHPRTRRRPDRSRLRRQLRRRVRRAVRGSPGSEAEVPGTADRGSTASRAPGAWRLRSTWSVRIRGRTRHPPPRARDRTGCSSPTATLSAYRPAASPSPAPIRHSTTTPTRTAWPPDRSVGRSPPTLRPPAPPAVSGSARSGSRPTGSGRPRHVNMRAVPLAPPIRRRVHR